MNRSFLCLVATPLLAVALSQPADAQQRMRSPSPSPHASVSQVIGITRVSVDYGRPGLRGRDVFHDGGVVPFNDPEAPGLSDEGPMLFSGPHLPWRAGADENTVITFEHDVTVQGEPLAAGSYGVHMFPSHDGPWTVAFSNDTGAWGSYTYSRDADALRVTASPTTGPKKEWLEYAFEDLGRDGATLVLAWDTTRLPLAIGVDTTAHVVAYLNDEYTRGHGFWSAQQLAQAATWCDGNDVNTEQALVWARRSAGTAPSFAAFATKASLEDKLGRTDDAAASRAAAEPFANEQQRNALGYQYMGAGQVARAIEVFTANLEQNPNSWNAHDSLAEACAANGETQRAIELYTKAREMAPDDQNRQRIDQVLATLRG